MNLKFTLVPCLIIALIACSVPGFCRPGVPVFGEKNANSALCSPPVSLQSFNITSSSAQLSWSSVNGPAETAWDLELVLSSNFFTGMPTVDSLTTVPFTAGALNSGTQYKYRVRARCADGSKSNWSSTHIFRTVLTNPSACAMNLSVADNSCQPSSNHFFIENHGTPGTALGTDVILKSVKIILQHDWVSDLEMRLVSPAGQTVLLASRVGSANDNFGNPASANCQQVCEFTDFCATAPINSLAAQPPFIGKWSPQAGNFNGFNDGSNPNGIWRLEICDSLAGNIGILKFAELVFASPNCLPPINVSATVLSSHTASITWQNPVNCSDSLILEFGPNGFSPGENWAAGQGIVFKIPCNQPQPFLLNGLQQLTDYDVYFRTKCGAGNSTSFNSCKKSFFTDCLSPTLVENFNNQNECGNACSGNAPACSLNGIWQNSTNDDWDFRSHQGFTPTSNTGPDDDAGGGGKYIYTESSCSSNSFNKKAELRSRCILVHSNGPCSMSFQWHLFGIHPQGLLQTGSITLEISLDNGQNWSQLFQKSGNQGNVWQKEFIDLTPFDNQIAIFRFTAISKGPFSDAALDDIRFFGSTDAGAQNYVFYKDEDGDGFGNPNQPLASCSPTAPVGFSENNDDCNDADFSIKPTAPEILCNGIDENCNGMADDKAIPAPASFAPASVCLDGSTTVTASSTAVGQFYWFDAPVGGNLLGTGMSLTLNDLTQNLNLFLLDSIFDAGHNSGCASPRTIGNIAVHPNPKIAILESPAICLGDEFDLSELTVVDSANTNGAVSWHEGNPANSGNKLGSPLVSPTVSTVYTVLATSAFGCTDQKMFSLGVNNLPQANILQGDSLTLCNGSTVNLNGSATGSSPFVFAWSGGNLLANWNFPTLPISALPGIQNFTLTVRDKNGCTDVDEIQINTAASISSVQINEKNNATACGASDGSLKITPLNGQPPYQFAWSGPTAGTLANQMGQTTITGLAQGSYQITITDAFSQNCSMVLPAQVINAPGLAVEIDSIFMVKCPSGADGKIELNLLDGQNPTYNWSNGTHFQDLSGVGAGLFSVTITEGNCSQVLKNLQVKQPANFLFLPNLIQKASCYGFSDGKIDLAVSGGTSPYSFFWSNNSTSEDIANLPAGAYRATLTDARGCTSISPFLAISQPSPISVAADSIHQISCAAGADGAIFLQTNGGNAGGYNWNWTGPNMTIAGPFLTNLSAGVYNVTATDLQGCTGTFSFSLAGPPALSYFSISTKNPTCVGVNDGEIWISGIGGKPPYQYKWSSGITSNQLFNLASGFQNLTITDANSCVFSTISPTLIAPQVIDFQLDSIKNVRCFGETNGQIFSEINGGTPPYSVNWNNGFSTDHPLQTVPKGKYQPVITDAFGCRLVGDSLTVSGPTAPLVAELVSKENASCFGLFDGSIDVEITGGTAPFSPMWNDSLAQEDLTNIGLGYWQFAVSDANGCTANLPTIIVGQPSEIQPNVTVQQIPCIGSSPASIELAPTGGFSGYTFLWSNDSTTNGIYYLQPGFYSATITDGGGCQQEIKSIQIFDPNDGFDAQTIGYQPVTCFGMNNGSADFTLLGGTPPFQIAINNGVLNTISNPNFTLENLGNGPVFFTVLDNAGCLTRSDTVFIEEPSMVFGFYENWLNPPCAGEASGHIFPNIVGGVQPYLFDWSLPGGAHSAQKNLVNIGPGTYQLTTTDLNGCSLSIPPITLVSPADTLSVAVDSLRHDNCSNGSGFIQVHATGGVPLYDYEWSNGDFGPVLEDLSPGLFELSVTDDSVCVKIFVFEIVAHKDTFDAVANIGNVACFGDSTGWVKMQIDGGTPPYLLNWSNGATTDSIFGLPTDNYILEITDAVGCSWTVGALVQQPAMPFVFDTIVVENALAGLSNGEICAFPQGGNQSGYTFVWSNQQTGQCANGLQTGFYSVTATDGNGCTIVADSILVKETVSANGLFLAENFKIHPNPASGKVSIFFENGQKPQPVSLTVYDVFGRKLVEIGPDFSKKGHFELDLTNWVAGIYSIKIWDSGGFFAEKKLVVVH